MDQNSWENISRTANKTDTQLVERYRKTALYATIKEALRRAREVQDEISDFNELANTPNLVLPVSEAAQLPSWEELASRWPGHADEQLQALVHDYENERRKLEAFDLSPIVERVKELAVQELEEDVEMEDVVMNMDV